MTTSTPPRGLGASGRALWTVATKFDLDQHETTILRQAVRVADLCDQLQTISAKAGPMITTPDEVVKIHPAVVELRIQRLTLARLITTLRIPNEDAAPLQRRGPRGVYGVAG